MLHLEHKTVLMKHLYAIAILPSMLFFACKNNADEVLADDEQVAKIELSLNQANTLASLPLDCVEKEYPNKTGHTLGSEEDLAGPKTLHPAFYGCFDWHSAVHGHWSMVKLLKIHPNLKDCLLYTSPSPRDS